MRKDRRLDAEFVLLRGNACTLWTSVNLSPKAAMIPSCLGHRECGWYLIGMPSHEHCVHTSFLPACQCLSSWSPWSPLCLLQHWVFSSEFTQHAWGLHLSRCAIILVYFQFSLALWPLDAHCLFEATDWIVELLWRPSTGLGTKYFDSVLPIVSLSPGPASTRGPLHLLSPCLESPTPSSLQGLVSPVFQAFAQVSLRQWIISWPPCWTFQTFSYSLHSISPTLFSSRVLSGILNHILIYLFIVCLSPLERSFHKDGDFICLFTDTSSTFPGT